MRGCRGSDSCPDRPGTRRKPHNVMRIFSMEMVMKEGMARKPSHLADLREHERHLIERLRRRELVARNLNVEHEKRLTLGDRVSDRLASGMGSWRFIIVQSIILAAWIILNVVGWVRHWDPYPFLLLSLAVNFQAAYAAPIIMMSQNREAEKDRLGAEHDYEINFKAEMEIEALQAKLDALSARWDELREIERRQLALLEKLGALIEERNSLNKDEG